MFMVTCARQPGLIRHSHPDMLEGIEETDDKAKLVTVVC